MKKSKYILESEQESKRLDFQSENHNYDPAEELPKDSFNLKGGEKILDAGCGTGIIIKLILQYYPKIPLEIDALDNSANRIKDLKENLSMIQAICPSAKIRCEKSDIAKIARPNNYYDLIICRFVFEHIPQSIKQVTEEFYRVLQPAGKLIVIDTDGIFYGLYTKNTFVKYGLQVIKANFPHYDSIICKKTLGVLINSGFTVDKIRQMPVNFFLEEDRRHEYKLWEMKFDQMQAIFEGILGKKDFEKFRAEYLKEIASPENLIYYDKFIFFAEK